MEYVLCFVLFCVGLYAVLVKRNIIKIVVGISIMGYAANLLFVLAGYRAGGGVPIFHENAAAHGPMVDPQAQAIALATITLGLSVTILLAALALRLHDKYGTLDVTEIRKLKG